jgi:hypothetical protein
MKLITEVEILGEPAEVVYKKMKVNHGTYEYGKIEIDSAASHRQQLRTLVHEMAHGVFRDSHDPDEKTSEEDFARMSEQLVTCIFRENPDLLQALAEEFPNG